MPVCPSCSSENPDGSRFCNTCGASLGAPRPVEGERKLTTVLFADVVRSTALAEQLDPEDWAAIMNGGFAFMNAAVTRFGGTVARLMGDAVLALFGAPLAHEDDAERAVRAGLALLASASEYGATVGRRYGVEFQVRVGINSGTSVLAYMGDEVKAEYTAMGDTANVAARLQSLALPGTLLISGDTRRLVRGLFELEPRGEVALKGKQEAVETFTVVGVKATPGKTRGLETEGLASPLVGRQAEVTRLEEALSALRAGEGRVVAVVGEAGIGKSRLVAELRAKALDVGVSWYEGRAVSYGDSLAYQPWRQLGREMIGAREPDGPAAVREQIASFVDRFSLDPAVVPVFETMLSVETAESRRMVGEVEGETRVQRISEAVTGALRAAMHARAGEGGPAGEPGAAADAVRPHVLVFDDLHWADAASLELIAQVATMAFSEPLLLLCVLRPDRAAPSWALLDRLAGTMGSSFMRLDLEPLDGQGASELLSNLLHIEDLPASVRTLILKRSEGNPFFLEEVLRALIDSGHVVRDDGHWRATREIAEVSIPETLAGVLSARIDRLPEATKRVAQTAAVLGRTFYYRALTSVCRSAPPPERIENVDPHLGTLTYEELVRERSREPEREYTFKHALTQEAAYGLLLKQRRRELHARAGLALEELYADRLEEVAPVLAYHFWQGDDPERTASYAAQAARSAVSLYALSEASTHFERAFEAMARLPDAPPEDLLDAIVGWAVVRYKLARYDGVVDRLLQAEKRAREIGDKVRLARILSWISLIYMVMGVPSQAAPYIQESASLAAELGLEQLLLLPFFFATETLADRDPGKAVKQFEDVITMAREFDMPEIEGHALASSAVAYARVGEFEKARERIAEALAAAPSGGHPVKEADVHLIVGSAFYELGEIEQGLEHARLGAELASSKHAIECACAGFYVVGMGELEKKELDQALGSFDRARTFFDAAHWAGWSGYASRINVGTASVGVERGSAEAIAELEKAIADAISDHDEYSAATASERLARAHYRAGRLDEALQSLTTAMQYYRASRTSPYEARALELEARIHEKAGRAADAERARQRATEIRARLNLAPAASG